MPQQNPKKKKKTKVKWLVGILLLVLVVLGGLGFLDPIKTFLNSEQLTFQVGSITFSIYQLIKMVLVVIVFLWVASIMSSMGEKYIKNLQGLKKGNRVLLGKIFQIFVYVIVFLLGLDVLGIDLTAFAVFGGAIGIGLGFGLQKVTSNFISGLILLFERSIMEDDLIELSDGTFGFVRTIGARHTLVEAFDGKEIMVPNEDFMTNRVVNWTYSNKNGRVEIKVGVAYGSDLELAKKLILEAAIEHPKCSKVQTPNCFLDEFADSSISFILYFWIEDITDGRLEPKSDVMFAIMKKFKENKIEIPFPQRDVHIKGKSV